MEKIIQYTVISGKIEDVIATVNKHIAEDGLEPFGHLVVRPSPEGAMYHQAMVKKFWDNTPTEFR
jgi:hypothetical protein